MSVINALALYFIIWWICLFLFLPLDISNQNNVEKGNDPGAPEKPNLKKKFFLNSIFSLFMFVLIFFILRIVKNETF